MDLVYGSEFGFVDGFFIKPQRTFVVNTNAPLHTSGFEVPQSGGVATFPESINYADRFIIWRAMGQKLYLEERSLLLTIHDGSLCIDFSRTPILPGTSITILEENVISIVVPTASTIHRFYAKLNFSKTPDTLSILSRIKEDDMIRRFHTAHVLTTPGRPIRASCTHHINRNTVVYCTDEGQLVVVTLNSFTDKNEKHEEIVFGDSGFFQKLLTYGQNDSNQYSDACVIKNPSLTIESDKNEEFARFFSDLVFAVTKKGEIQAWNVETKKQIYNTLNLNKLCWYSLEDDEIGSEDKKEIIEKTYNIKAYSVETDILLVIGSNKIVDGNCIGVSIHLVKASNDQLTHIAVYEKPLMSDEKLVDFGILQVGRALTDEQSADNEISNPLSIPLTTIPFNLTTMFKSSSVFKTYVLRRISLGINWKTLKCYTQFRWHEVKRFSSSSSPNFFKEKKNEDDSVDEALNRPYNLSPESSVELLADIVFDTDLHSFDVVHRAIQVVTDRYRGPIGQVQYNCWSDLQKLVESYETSVEFYRKFQQKTERNIRFHLKATSETQQVARKNFWWALLRACEELDFAAKGAIAVAPMTFESDLQLMLVIHRDRTTVLGDNNLELFSMLVNEDELSDMPNIKARGFTPNEKVVDLIEKAAEVADNRIILMNRERARNANARNGFSTPEDELFENGYDYEHDGYNLDVHPSFQSMIVALAKQFVESANYDTPGPFDDGEKTQMIFGGSFVQSIISSNIRVTIEKRAHFALTLRSLLNGISHHCVPNKLSKFGEVDSLKIELREIIRIYRELIDQLDVKIIKNGAKMSLCTWLISDRDGLLLLRKEGGAGRRIKTRKVGETHEEKNEEEEEKEEVKVAEVVEDFKSCVGNTTEAAVRALLSTSEVLVLFRRLVDQKEFKILLTILNGYIDETRSLKPVINFYRGIALSGTNHPAKALTAFKSAFNAFVEGNSALRKAVYYLLPREFVVPLGREAWQELGSAEYYLTVVRFLQEHGHTEEVISIGLSVIETLPVEDDSVQLISNTLFNRLTSRNEWFKALKLILKTTLEEATRRASICELLSLMMAKGDWESIATMAYGKHEQVVEDFLREEASRQSPNEKNHIYELLFAYYVARKDFRMGACAMYEYAKHIESSKQMTAELLKKRRDALGMVLNMQSIISIDPEDQDVVYDDHLDTNLVFPTTEEVEEADEYEDILDENQILRKEKQRIAQSSDGTNRHLNGIQRGAGDGPTENDNSELLGFSSPLTENTEELRNFAIAIDENDGNLINSKSSGKAENLKSELKKRKKVLVLTEKQIRAEFIICSARVALLSSEHYDGIPPTDIDQLYSALVDTCLFDAAFDVVKQFELNPYKLFFVLTREAIMIDTLRNKKAIEMAVTQLDGWVQTNRRHCNAAVAGSGDHWTVVRGLIDAGRVEWNADSRMLRGATEAFLKNQLNVPYWLHSMYENADMNDYLRSLIDYEAFETAFEVVADSVERETIRISTPGARTWLPYQKIEELMKMSGNFIQKVSNQKASKIATLRKKADEKLVAYFKKLESFENALQMSSKFS